MLGDMMKPKQYLRSIGIDIPENQRGRMSKENKALIEKAVAEGIAIEGYAVKATKTNTPTAAPVVEKVAVSNVKTIADIPSETYDENALLAKVNGATIGMRTVCHGCRNSITYCWCKSPSVLLDGGTVAMVTFTSRPANSPRVNRWW